MPVLSGRHCTDFPSGSAPPTPGHETLEDRQRLPVGTTSRPKVALVTRAKLPYMAKAPHKRPTQPPSIWSVGLPATAPPPSRKKAIHRVRNIPNSSRDSRKVDTQSPRVKRPHSRRQTPIVLPAPDRSSTWLPPSRTKSANHHQKAP